MSHNIRSKTYMQVASHRRNQRMQAIQMALAILVLTALVFMSQLARRVDTADSVALEPTATVEQQQYTWDGKE